MSETEQKEIEIVQGVIEGVTQKKPDTWQVEVKPNGSQYTKKLWTKDAELVTSLSAKLGQAGAFVCGASYWTNQSGAQVRSLWINGLSDGTEIPTPNITNVTRSVATPGAAPQGAPALVKTTNDVMTKEEWARKDSAIHKMACIKTAADALKHTVPSDPSDDDLGVFLRRCMTLSASWHRSVLAERDDPAGEDVPF